MVAKISASMVAALALLAGCSGASQDPRFPTGGQSVVSSSRGDVLYVANVDQGTVSVVDPAGGVTEVPVGAEPSRIARANGKVYVTLRAERKLAVLSETETGLVLDGKIEVGTEPFGVAASEDGRFVYVAASTQGEVVEIDAATQQITRRFAIEGQPKWIALHPSGKTLYIGSAYGGRVSWIDLSSGKINALPLPVLTSVLAAGPDGMPAPLTPRITGDISVSPLGDVVAIPSVYVDNSAPVGEPSPDGVVQGGYGSDGGIGLSRINPIITEVLVGSDGTPSVESAQPVNVASSADFGSESVVAQVMRSYPSSITFAPDAQTMYITMEGSQAVIAASVRPTALVGDRGEGDFVVMDTGGGFGSGLNQVASTATAVILVPEGPTGVAFLADGSAYVHTFLDYRVSKIDAGQAASLVTGAATRDFSPLSLRATDAVQVTRSVLPDQVDLGRRLFYSSVTPSMAGAGSGVSCATCHMDGRNDGITWTFDEAGLSSQRQTPSLAGKVSETLPLTWMSDVPSVGDEVRITSQGRMGGQGLSFPQELAVAAYVDFTREVDHPAKGSPDAAVARGKAIFERSEVGCASCHAGSRLADDQPHDLYGLRGVYTPSLTGVAVTAPYLHDGSAATLEDVLASAGRGEMGDTSSLSASELSDLLAYLKSL
jgi:YVTN family beta-propeller protein